MKSNFPRIALARLCGWFGLTRQAYYNYLRQLISTVVEEELVLRQVKGIRKKHPRIGTRKLYTMLQPFLTEHQVKMGRDALFSLLSIHHLLIRKHKRRVQTTYSYHWLRKYPNLIRQLVPTGIHQLWISDITYWKIITGEHLYISFVTDAYSHKIVGYQVAETMEAIESVQALKMAVDSLKKQKTNGLIHHSDRGIQYCSQSYVKLLQDYKINISMTENGDPLENAIAERVNGIIKDEYLETYEVNNIKEAKKLLQDVVDLYNNERPHMSISNLTPNQVHHSPYLLNTQKLWKNYYRKLPTFVNQ